MLKNVFSSLSTALAMLLVLSGTKNAFPQKVDEQVEAINGAIYSQLSTQNSVEFNRVTSKGELLYCSLSFTFAMRDYGARKGAVLIGEGSINLNIISGRSIDYFLKLVVRGVDPTDLGIKPIQVGYLDLKINERALKEFKILEQEGEFLSKLVVLEDRGSAITKLFSDNPLTKGSIIFSLQNETLDKEVFLAKISPAEKLQSAHIKFLECSLEFIEKKLGAP